MRRRWCGTSVWLVVMCLAGFAACGGGDPDPSGNFVNEYQGDIDYDCKQSVNCLEEMQMTVPGNFYEGCRKDEAKALNANPAQQPLFLTRITRCTGRMSCDWQTCLLHAPNPEYGMTQIDKLNYLCQAETQCKIDNGMQVGDAQTVNANCAGTYVGTADNWSVMEREQFEQAFAGCSTTTSCAFLGCMGMMGVNTQQ